MKPLELVLLAPESWRPVESSTGRGSNRTSERELDRMPAAMLIGGRSQPVRLRDYSPFGFTALPVGPEAQSECRPGMDVRLRLDIGGFRADCGCRVENASVFKGQARVGLSRRDLASALPEAADALRVGDSLILWGEIRNPFLYGEWCALRLVAIRPGMQLVFTSVDPTLCLFPGMELDVELGVPSSGDNGYRGKVAALARTQGDTLAMVLEPVRFTARLAGELAELLASDCGASPEDLKALGFPVRFLRDSLHFRHAQGEADRERVEAFRRTAGREPAGIFAAPGPSSARPASGDRIFCAFHQDVLVATASLAFPEAGASRLAAPDGRVPESCMEILDIAAHPDYRRGDLWLSLVERISRLFLLSDRKRLLRACDDRLLPLYRRLGFRRLGKARGGGHLVALDRSAILAGRGVALSSWLVLYGDLVQDFLDKRLYEPPPWRSLALRAKLRLKPWIRARMTVRAERLFRQCLGK